MALTQNRGQIRGNVQKLANVAGTTALQRHPTADLDDYINRGIGSLYRILTAALPDQRYLASQSIATIAGTSLYTLAADFDSLISIDLTANGTKVWLEAYAMNERPILTDPASTYSGIPYTYRLRGANIELLPAPSAVYTSTLWYVPTSVQLASDGATFDTISRLDDYVIAYAARFVAIRDKNWDLARECKGIVDELRSEVETLARARDKNSPSRPVDETLANRWGRRVPMPRRWQ